MPVSLKCCQCSHATAGHVLLEPLRVVLLPPCTCGTCIMQACKHAHIHASWPPAPACAAPVLNLPSTSQPDLTAQIKCSASLQSRSCTTHATPKSHSWGHTPGDPPTLLGHTPVTDSQGHTPSLTGPGAGIVHTQRGDQLCALLKRGQEVCMQHVARGPAARAGKAGCQTCKPVENSINPWSGSEEPQPAARECARVQSSDLGFRFQGL